MKRIISALLLLVLICFGKSVDLNNSSTGYTISSNSDYGFSFDFNIKDINFEKVETEKGSFNELWFEGSQISGTPGEPNLPVYSTLFTVPHNAKVDISVENLEKESLSLKDMGISSPIIPAQPSYPKNIDPSEIKFNYNESAYNMVGFAKNELVSVEKMGTMRGVDIYRMTLSPINYSPADGRLEVSDNFGVKVNFDGVTESALNEAESKRSIHFEDNFKAAINYNHSTKSPVDLPTSYLIVAPQNLAQNGDLHRFIDWKKQKGFNVVTNFIEPSATVADVDSWVEDKYQNLDPAPAFLLLVGDMDGDYAVPTKTSNIGGASVSDLTYGVIGNPSYSNHVKSIYTGRFSVRSLSDLKNQVDKTIWYEKEQFTQGADLNYLKRGMGVAGHDTNGYTYSHGNPHIRYQMTYYFNDTYTNPTTGETNGMEGLQYLNGASGADDEIIGNINDGVAFYNYTAHGLISGFGGPNLYISDIMGMTNEGKYGLVIGNCCLTGSFGSPVSFGEAWLTAENKGSIGYIGASESTYWNEDLAFGVGKVSTGNTTPAYSPTQIGSVDAVMLMEFPSMGGIMQAGLLAVDRSNGSIMYYWNMYHLFGDPSLNLFMGVPDDITVSHNDAIEANQATTINVSTGIENALVGIFKKGELSEQGVTDGSGNFSVSVSPEYAGAISVTVSKPQHKTYYGEITVNGTQTSPFNVNLTSIDESNYWENPTTHNVTIENSSSIARTISGALEADNNAGKIKSAKNLFTSSEYEKMYGVADGGDFIWVSSEGKTSSSDPNMFLKFDKNGNLLQELEQNSEARKGVYGICYKDGFIYGSDDDAFYKFDTSTGDATILFNELSGGQTKLKELTMMGDHFVTYDNGFIKFDTSGNIVEEYAPTSLNLSMTDIEYDPVNNSFWIFAAAGNPASMFYEYSIDSEELTGRTVQIELIDGASMQQAKGFYLSLLGGEKPVAHTILKDGDVNYFATAHLTDEWLTLTGDISGEIAPNSELSFDIELNSFGIDSDEVREGKISFVNDFGIIELNISLTSMGSDITETLVEDFSIKGNYPNPFNPETTILFNLPHSGDMKMVVFNSKGETVHSKLYRSLSSGDNTLKFNGSGLNSGVYFYSLQFNNSVKTGKMVLVK